MIRICLQATQNKLKQKKTHALYSDLNYTCNEIDDIRYEIIWIVKLANASLVVSFIMLIPLLISLICVLCLLYDPPEVPAEDYYGPIDHALQRFRGFYGQHVLCYMDKGLTTKCTFL